MTTSAWAGCPEQEAWAKRCDSEDFRFEVQACPDGVIVGTARIRGKTKLPVELKPASEQSFRRVGDTGVQPIGEFPDWNAQPTPQRDTLDAMLACVEHAGPPPFPVADTEEPKGKSPRLLLAGLLLLAVALGLRVSLTPTSARKHLFKESLAVCGFAIAVFGIRWWLVPPAMFHQNGQGPLWVLFALDSPSTPQVYGPGYAEMTGWLAARVDPELAVYLISATLFALMLPAAFAIARSVGLGRVPTWALIGSLAVHPLGARLAGSESYYATLPGLAMLACLAMVLAVQPEHELHAPRRRWLFITGTLAAATLIAQAARVHPVGWSALACLAFVPLSIPGPLRRRLFRTAMLCGAIAVLVLGTSALEMLRVLAGEIGQKWLPRSAFSWTRLLLTLSAFPALAVLGRRRRAVLPAFAFCLVLGLLSASHPIPGAAPRIAHAMYWLYLPALLGTFACWLAQLGSLARSVGCACAVGVTLGAGWEYRANYLTLATDALEIRAANIWKRELPVGSYVAYVSRAGRRVMLMPFYDDTKIEGVRITDETGSIAPAPELYYYRSSVCSTDEGRALCRKVESDFELTPIEEHTFPSVASLQHLPMGSEPVRVGLFKAKLRTRPK
ncbi:MAG: hypothetical protein H6718_09545 [Polyangiaceae bacterium]|nr:hypothetical protein [Myxococcales bacterium]MCB9585631.1 hypothetical protein [Polyangiaceae bacterium]MCB9606353.1 hypothetical protein [Polyangiaceae bacterium]